MGNSPCPAKSWSLAYWRLYFYCQPLNVQTPFCFKPHVGRQMLVIKVCRINKERGSLKDEIWPCRQEGAECFEKHIYCLLQKVILKVKQVPYTKPRANIHVS